MENKKEYEMNEITSVCISCKLKDNYVLSKKWITRQVRTQIRSQSEKWSVFRDLFGSYVYLTCSRCGSDKLHLISIKPIKVKVI